MARTLKPITASERREIDAAIVDLRRARDLLRQAGATQAAKYVARALKSAEGARRHADHRPLETERQRIDRLLAEGARRLPLARMSDIGRVK